MSQPPQKKTVMSALDQLKKHTVVVADSGDIKGKCVFMTRATQRATASEWVG